MIFARLDLFSQAFEKVLALGRSFRLLAQAVT